MKLKLFIFAALLLCLTAPQAARALVTFSFTPPAQTGNPGSILYFTGTLSNTSTTDTVFLNSDSLTLTAPASLTADDSPFLTNAPTSLAPAGQTGSSYSGSFFDVTLASDAPAGTYSGTFIVMGGADANASDTVASQDFSVTVQPASAAPEPSQTANLSLIAAGLMGLALRARRRKAAPVL